MKVLGVAWLGSRTENFEALSDMFGRIMGIRKVYSEDGLNVFKTENGDLVEVFGMQHKDASFFPEAPVAGFLVENIEEGIGELRENGIEIVGKLESDDRGNRWCHFVAPDGNMYELTERKSGK